MGWWKRFLSRFSRSTRARGTRAPGGIQPAYTPPPGMYDFVPGQDRPRVYDGEDEDDIPTMADVKAVVMEAMAAIDAGKDGFTDEAVSTPREEADQEPDTQPDLVWSPPRDTLAREESEWAGRFETVEPSTGGAEPSRA